MSPIQTAGRALFEALQVGLVVFLTVLSSPKKSFPDIPEWLIDLSVAVVIAFVLVLFRLLALPRAHLEVHWVRANDAHELREVDVLINAESKEGGQLAIKVMCERAWGLGWVALRFALHQGLWIRTRSPHARFGLIPDFDRGFEDEPMVKAGKGCQVMIRLVAPITEAGEDWNDVVVTPRGHKSRQLRTTGLRHKAIVDGKLGWICALMIKVDSKATKITERWS